MFQSSFYEKSSHYFVFCFIVVATFFNSNCAVEAAKEKNKFEKEKASVEKVSKSDFAEVETTISFVSGSPADTVKVFYKNLREQKFREALFLTNLRPAIEGLNENELKDLQLDFAPLAGQIPADVAINGEIISGNLATVTAKLPDNETDLLGLQEIRLRKEGDFWIILTVDDEAENLIKKEGKNYFFALKIETHQAEAKAMLNRIDKAQMIYSLKNKGIYADIPTLIANEYLPEDISTSYSTGYIYKIYLTDDKKGFKATAEPAVYGKTGKFSYWFEVKENKSHSLQKIDTNGKELTNKK